jgi:hypothetical protein
MMRKSDPRTCRWAMRRDLASLVILVAALVAALLLVGRTDAA